MQLRVPTRGPGSSPKARELVTDLVFALGGVLLVWSAAIHYHLWDDGYRSLATLGGFLISVVHGLEVAAAVVLGLAALLSVDAGRRDAHDE